MAESVFYTAKKTIFWTIALFIITILLFVLVIGMGQFQKGVAQVPLELRAQMTSLRFSSSEDCFAFSGAQGAVIRNSIDLSKWTQERMDACYATPQEGGERYMNFRLKLAGVADEVESNNYFGRDHFTLERTVLVYDGSDFFETQLLIFVQEGL